MDSFFEEKIEDSSPSNSSSSWLFAHHKHSHSPPSSNSHLTYSQAAMLQEARAKAERAALQVRQHRRALTPPSPPSEVGGVAPSIPSVPSTSTSSEFPRRRGSPVCLRFIKGMSHPKSGCPFDHPTLSDKDFHYCKRLCSFFPTNSCDFMLGHKEKKYAKPREETCDFVHELVYFDDATGTLLKVKPRLNEDGTIATADVPQISRTASQNQQHTRGRQKAQSLGDRRPSRKPRQSHERGRSEREAFVAPAGAAAVGKEERASMSSEMLAEALEHVSMSEVNSGGADENSVYHLLRLGLDEHISSSSSSSAGSPVTSIASTSRSSTISPINLPPLSHHSPSTSSSTPSRFSHSHSHDFESLPPAASLASNVPSNAVSSSNYSFPLAPPSVARRASSDLYSSQMSPQDDLDELSAPWLQKHTSFFAKAGENGNGGMVAGRVGIENGGGVAGIAGYDSACKLSAPLSDGLMPGTLWRLLSAEEQQTHQQERQTQQFMQPKHHYLEPPMMLPRPTTPPAALLSTQLPSIYPSQPPSSAPSSSAAVSPRTQPRADSYPHLSEEVLHRLKAQINSLNVHHPGNFFERLDMVLARSHVSATHPILAQLFLKRFPQESLVLELLDRVRKQEEARRNELLNQQFHAISLAESNKHGFMNTRQPTLQPFPPASNTLAASFSTPLPLVPPAAIKGPSRVSHPLSVYLPIHTVATPAVPLATSASTPVLTGLAKAAMFTPAALGNQQNRRGGGGKHWNGRQPSMPQMHLH